VSSERRRRLQCGVFLGVLLALPGAIHAGTEAELRAPIHDDVVTGLSDLHHGLYSSAEERFRSAAATAPGDPVPLFLLSFSRWWRLLLERQKGAYDDEIFDQMIESVIREGAKKIEENPGDYYSMAAVGGAHILRSHVEAMRKNYFRGAREAGRGKKVLEAALEFDPTLEAALFPLGAFNYYADNVPIFVKGIRFLLFIPGGDGDLGLQQIRTVAESDGLFRIDARLLLAGICARDNERSYHEAVEHLNRALADAPDSPVVLALAGRLQLKLGNYHSAGKLFMRALIAAHEDAPERDRQRLRLRLAIAEAAIAGWRLDFGAEHLLQVPRDGGAMSTSMLQARGRLERELVEKRSGAAWVQRFRAGLRLFDEQHFAEALEAFAAAKAVADSSPSWFEGGAALHSGIAERHLGEERRARNWLRLAAKVHRFRSADRARLELQGDEPGNPECAP
jgi:tetratricopeptide (TPR) repeat protein